MHSRLGAAHRPEQATGQATFEMANLRPERTGLPFVVFVSQRGGARHDVRVKVARGPKIQTNQMGTYAVRPFRFEGGLQLSSPEERNLEEWVGKNLDVLVGYLNGDIQYTEDAFDRLVSI